MGEAVHMQLQGGAVILGNGLWAGGGSHPVRSATSEPCRAVQPGGQRTQEPQAQPDSQVPIGDQALTGEGAPDP